MPTMMNRSVSSPSLGTIGTETLRTNTNSVIIGPSKAKLDTYKRGKFLWEGRLGRVTYALLGLPWKMWWQVFILLIIVYKYTVIILLRYYLERDSTLAFVMHVMSITEVFYITDLCINMLHAFWPLVRFHMRVYRKHYIFLFYDFFSVIPFYWIYLIADDLAWLFPLSRWTGTLRIYRLYTFFIEVNEGMRSNRKMLFLLQHLLVMILILHATTCIWYFLRKPGHYEKPWYNMGYPVHSDVTKLKFNTYINCFYYCACRIFNVIFADSYPSHASEKWLTIFLSLIGFVCFRYRFIGYMTWEYVLENKRWSNFVEMYHHMLNYLQFCGAPAWLVEQAQNYKLQLWQMKDGIMTSDHLRQLPHPLQMQLIFDINVGHFHNSLLFRDTGEAFLRQVSLLMKHELFLAGQQIWSQGVVKSGMICIKQGVVEMLSDEDDESPMIAFKEETVLGEISLFYSIPSKVTVKAATYVEVQVLRRTDFLRAMLENPVMLKQIRGKIDKRLKTSKTKQDCIDRYDKGDSRLIRTRYRPMKVLKDNLAGVEGEDPTFVDDSHMYYRDDQNVRQPKFTTEYLELYKLSSNVTTVDAPKICLKSNFPWILEPNTSFTFIFDIVHFCMVLYVCLMIPYLVIKGSQSEWQKVLGIIVFAGLLFNIYIQLTTANVRKNIRKDTVKKIAEDKMATVGFYLDVLSVFPVHIFSETLDPQGESILGHFAKLFPILQVWHLWDYIGKWEKSFNRHLKLLCLCKYSLTLIIFCYWSGCLLYIFACPKKLCVENSWMAKMIFWETKMFAISNSKHERPLLSALSFGTGVFTGGGLAEISPGSGDLLLVAVLFMTGSYICCMYTAKMCSLFLLSTQRRLRFKESMRELFYFLTVNRVSSKIKARVEKFFFVQWYYNNAVSTEEIFKDISSNIQQEVLSIETVKTLLCCPLFQNCSRDFLQTVAATTRTIILPDNEVVQHAADISRDMYILQMGHCKVLNYTGKVVVSLGPGKHFGVIEMLFGLPKVYTVITTTNCQLRHLEYSALVQCWSSFPNISVPITQTLQDPELIELAARYEEAKPLTGKLDVKTNRIAQEIKESFVMLSTEQQRAEFIKAFERLGIMRYIRFIFLPGCITPYGIFLKLWCGVRFVLAIYYILLIPYNIAIKQHTLARRFLWPDIILYLDIVVMCYVSYYDERSILVTHPLLIVTRYLKRAFLWDLISVFPFEYLFQIVNENTNVDLCRINRMLLVTRITGAFSYWESDIMNINAATVLIKFLPTAATFVNFMTAFLFMNTCIPYFDKRKNAMMVNCTRTMMINDSHYERLVDHTSRQHRIACWDQNPFVTETETRYIRTLFWVFEVFLGCGCTPLMVINRSDEWQLMILQVTGYLYFAFMFGYVASTRSAAAHALLEHTENTTDLKNFLYQENVDPNLTDRTLKYFEYVWKRTNGSNPQLICRCLNSALMEDTLVFMYERALREVPLFGKVERSFIRVITQHLNEMYFVKGETVVQCRDVQHSIYIIYRGKVDVMSSYNEMLTCMGPGGMFGNFTGQPMSCSEVSIYASRSLDLLVIPSQTFINLTKYYPKIHEPLKRAFQISKDYILPINMDVMDDSNSESDAESASQDTFDSMSTSSRRLTSESSDGIRRSRGTLSSRSSHSNMSTSKSSVSVMTYQSVAHMSNILRPGSLIYQGFGYLCCFMVTMNYAVLLYEIVTLNNCYFIYWMQTIFDIFFYIKVFLNMHQGYLNKRGDFIIAGSMCRDRYFRKKTRMWSDILVNFPLENIAFVFERPLTLMHYLRINKLFRIKYLIEFYRKTSAELTNNLTTLQLATTLLVVVLLIHTFTCVWLLTLTFACPTIVIRTLKSYLLDDDGPRSWDYTTSLYVMLAGLTTTGGDEFLLENVLQMAIMALALISGKMLASIIVATTIQVAHSTKYALNCYEETSRELIDMLKNQGLSVYQLEKFWKYIKQLWVYERGRQLPVLLSQTPYVRRCDLMSAMFGHHLRNCYLFNEVGEPFLRQLTAVLDYTVFFPGNYIVTAGDNEARMYFVASGTVQVVSVRADLTETIHEMLGAGDVFGIFQGLDRGITHCFSYRAETKASILTLNLDSWINILPFFPEAKAVIAERAEHLFAIF